ncbi:MAG TPA: hypothetical protein VFQ67_06925 [Allosphingosinicella sp.]|jgi:hypothetical protein|nr:hypothetical protein [Allosphingosinicella sp.]
MKFKLKLVTLAAGRKSFPHDWEALHDADLVAWGCVEDWFTRVRVVKDNHAFLPSIDLSPLVSDLRRRHIVARAFYDRGEKLEHETSRGPVHSTVAVEVSGSHPERYRYRAETLLQYLMCQAFCILNLTVPGCCDLGFAALIHDPPIHDLAGEEIRWECDLSGHFFEAAWRMRDEIGWKAVEILDPRVVERWLWTVSPPEEVGLRNPLAECIFILLRLARTEYGPLTLLWALHALENLFGQKGGRGFLGLSEPIGRLLGLRGGDLADLRSALRRQDLALQSFLKRKGLTTHPTAGSPWSPDDPDGIAEFERIVDIAAYILVGCVQQTIIRQSNDESWKAKQYGEQRR